MKFDYRLSIIIPHHNNPELLKKLLSTIPDNHEIQTIVVDDHSSDEVKIQLRKLQSACEDRNVFFYDNDSGEHNAGAARNVGLAHAEGKWLLFADSDDYFLDGFYDIIEKYLDSDYDIVYFSPTSIDMEIGGIGERHRGYIRYIKKYRRWPRLANEINLRYFCPYPWSKLIRRSIVWENNIRFDSVKFSNDEMFSVRTGFFARRITASDETIYCVTRRTGSLTTQQDLDAFDIRVQVSIRKFWFLKTHLNKRELHACEICRIAILKLLTIIRRKYGRQCFAEYFRLFRKNHMLPFDLRVLKPVPIIHWIRSGFIERSR